MYPSPGEISHQFTFSGHTVLVMEDDCLQASDLADMVRSEQGHVIGLQHLSTMG